MTLKVLLTGYTEKVGSAFIDASQAEEDIVITSANSGSDALKIASRGGYDLVVVAQTLCDMDCLQFARKLVQCCPMTNCAVSNQMPADVFHEKSEGLGLLAQLPVTPSAQDARKLFRTALQIKKLSTPS